MGPSGNIYVADSGHNRVLVYSPTGTLLARGERPKATAPPAAGRANSTARTRSRSTAPETSTSPTPTTTASSSSPPAEPCSTNGARAGPASGRFRYPTGIALDAAGRVYVVDRENNRVQVFDAGGNFLGEVGLRRVGLGEFSQPTAIAVDCNGDVYVADTNNNRVQRFEPAAPAPTGCEAAGTWPPPLDVAPVVRVSGPADRRRALAPRAGPGRQLRTGVQDPRDRHAVAARQACADTARGGRALAPEQRHGPCPAAAVGPRSLRHLQRALGRRRLMRARVQIVAAGPTGRRTVITRTYIVGRWQAR